MYLHERLSVLTANREFNRQSPVLGSHFFACKLVLSIPEDRGSRVRKEVRKHQLWSAGSFFHIELHRAVLVAIVALLEHSVAVVHLF
jgi:hypothetical protein